MKQTLTVPYEVELLCGKFKVVYSDNPHFPENVKVVRVLDDSTERDLGTYGEEKDAAQFLENLREEIDDVIFKNYWIEKELPESVMVAVAWWRQVLTKGGKKDNGVPFHQLVAETLLNSLPGPEEAKLDEFCRLLSIWTAVKLEKSKQWEYPSVGLSCDYGPGYPLYSLAAYCGIESYSFPYKTCMWIYENNTVVRYGYHAEEEVLYGPYSRHDFKEIHRNQSKYDLYFSVFFQCTVCGCQTETFSEGGVAVPAVTTYQLQPCESPSLTVEGKSS